MGGKKKKNMATKLAKMTDEERARYMQHRAEMEEEAKRRKEQLIATFMKKKVRKEEGFSRLNQAKINQNWHQILRKTKCRQMKEDVEHVKEWMDRTIDYKNRTIAKLIKYLEDSEEDYYQNFNIHLKHLENVLKKQADYVEKLYEQYKKEVEELMLNFRIDRDLLCQEADQEQTHLKTILYRQEIYTKETKREIDYHSQIYYETENDFEEVLQKVVKSQEKICEDLYKEIEKIITNYINKIDTKRMEYADLLKEDTKSAKEIEDFEEKIKQKKEDIRNLRDELEEIKHSNQQNVTQLEEEIKKLNAELIKSRKDLQTNQEIHTNKLQFLVGIATETKDYLEQISRKGDFILTIAEKCKNFQSEREKLSNWIDTNLTENNEPKDDTTHEEIIYLLKDPVTEELTPYLKLPTPSPETLTSVQTVTLQEKSPATPTPDSSQPSEPGDFIESWVTSLEPLENFWRSYNKVKFSYSELKREKASLEGENKQLRGLVRAVLEAAALDKSKPGSKVSTRVPSRRLSACSPGVAKVDIFV